ncbi:hypothetical protein BAURA86_01091 [Brevibacterium aurantiacum]|uniref:Uncharacterized protein n=1 Tax=Brevibacterium aurantiacum TaxID=273384 RepID=A0A2H1IXJ3_BREAU|nr:hypothetical protein BAURA86_01091 [Brevibacterium aurantiacum]
MATRVVSDEGGGTPSRAIDPGAGLGVDPGAGLGVDPGAGLAPGTPASGMLSRYPTRTTVDPRKPVKSGGNLPTRADFIRK